MNIKGEVALCCSGQHLNHLDPSMTSCPPLIINSPRFTCQLHHIASGLRQSLAPVAAQVEATSTAPLLTNSLLLQSTPLHLAAGYNRVRIVQLLLQHGADVHAKDKGWGMLSWQIHVHLNRFFNSDSWLCSGLVPLHNACSYGHFEVTELLLKVSNHHFTSLIFREGLGRIIQGFLTNAKII